MDPPPRRTYSSQRSSGRQADPDERTSRPRSSSRSGAPSPSPAPRSGSARRQGSFSISAGDPEMVEAATPGGRPSSSQRSNDVYVPPSRATRSSSGSQRRPSSQRPSASDAAPFAQPLQRPSSTRGEERPPRPRSQSSQHQSGAPRDGGAPAASPLQRQSATGATSRRSREAAPPARPSDAATPPASPPQPRAISPSRAAFKRGVTATVQMLKATQPGLRKGLLQDQKEADLAQLVESNLQLGELAPLVRYVFEGQDAPGQAAWKRRQGAKPAAEGTGENESLQAIKRVLRNVMVHEKAVITSWCSRNASQMRAALESVAGLQEQAAEMEGDLSASHQGLRKAGDKMVENMAELQEAVKVATFVSLAHDTVTQVVATVQELAKAAKHLQNDELHLALTIVNSLQQQNELLAMYPLPAKEKHPDLRALSDGEYELLNVMVKATHSLLGAVRRQAKRSFHDWLTATREAAKGIGGRAVRRAAAQRAHEELLSQERKMLQGLLIKEQKNFKAAKALVLQFIAQEDPAYGRSSIKQKSGAASQTPAIPAATQAAINRRFKRQNMRAGRNVDTDESANALSLLDDVDMSGLHRCVHVHNMLGDIQSFKEYYYEQRHLQLLANLAPPASMLEAHRAYLSHIAGFFIMEEKVKQSTENIIMPTELRGLWATAVASIKHAMDAGFTETDSTAAMLVIKDFVYLTSTCLATYQFDVSAIMASLAQYRDRYHDLLNQELALSVRIALRNDLRSLTMTSEAQVESVMTSSGLPQTLTPGAPPPRLPFKAPFSSALPSIVQAIESYIVASLQFCQGVLHSYELLATMREQRDRFISNLLVDLMASHASKLAHEADLKSLVLMSGDAGCLALVLASLDEYTIVVMRGSEEHAEEDLMLVARALTRRSTHIAGGGRKGNGKEPPAAEEDDDDVMAIVTQSVVKMQDKVREALEEALETQVAQHVKGALNQSWAPEEPLSEQLSPWMEQLIGALEEAFALGESCMPPDKLVAMKRRAFALVDEHLAALFSGAALRAWNPHGMRRFAGDVDAMLQLAGRHGCEKSLLRVDDLCSFLVREQWHLAGNTEHLTSSYPNMDPPLLVAAMHKYEPGKVKYVDRLRQQHMKQASKSDIAGFARDIENAISNGKLGTLMARARR